MKDFPVIKLTIFFALGILCGEYFKIPIETNITLILFLLVMAALISVGKKSFLRYSLVVIIPLTIFFSGFLSINLFSNSTKKYPFDQPKIKNAELYGSIKKLELNLNKGIQLQITCDSVRIGIKTYQLNHELLARIIDDNKRKLDSCLNELKVGNYISLAGTISKARDKRNPGEFDFSKYLETKNISGIFTSYSTNDVKKINSRSALWENLILDIKKIIYKRIDLLFDKNTAILMKGLLLGDRSELDEEIKTDFINTGVVHVLAVSGMHVVYILLIITIISGRFSLYIQSILTSIVLILFMFLTGMQPSVIRAVIMAFVIIAALLTNRSTNIFNSMAISAFIILIFNPIDLFNPGFQLSYAAVISIAIFYSYFDKLVRKLNIKIKFVNSILLLVAVTISAQLGTLPFILAYFHKLSIISILANIVVVPLTGVMVSIGIFTLVVSIVSIWIAQLYAIVLILMTKILFWFTHLLSSQSFAFIPIRQFSLVDSILYLISLAAICLIIKRSSNLKYKIISVSIIIACSFIFVSLDDYELLPEGKLSVMAIDVGQGDAFLVKFPDNTTALIDAGEATQYFDNGDKIISPLLDYAGIDKIDYGFISHVDSDHYSGFISLIGKDRIRQIYKPVIDSTSIKDLKLEKYLHQQNIPIVYYKNGVVKIGNTKVYFLFNPVKQRLTMNDKSGIIKIVYGNNSFLFVGDAEIKQEKLLINNFNSFLKSDVLKLGHHGSANSSSEEFLKYVYPKYGIISAGIMNKFNHPAPVTLMKLSKYGVNTLRTDNQGGIILTSDGKSIQQIKWREWLH